MDERPHAADCIAANASSWSALGAGRAIQRSSLREFYFLVVSFSNGAAAPLEGFEMTGSEEKAPPVPMKRSAVAAMLVLESQSIVPRWPARAGNR